MTYSFGIILLLIGVIVIILGFRSNRVDGITERLYLYVGGEDQSDSGFYDTPRYRRPRITGSFRSRVITPVFHAMVGFFGRLTPGRISADMEKQLAIAGNPLGLGANEFYGIRIVFSVVGIVLAFMIFQSNVNSSRNISPEVGIAVTGSPLATTRTPERPISLTGMISSMLVLVIVSTLPKTWLRRKVRIRKTSIQKSLPDALDMLSVCAEAGLGFDQSLQRISTSWDNTLAREFSRVVTEIGMGVSRKVALRNLSDRTDVPELSSFVAVIIQSDQLGMSITQTLHAQAKQMRIERRFRAQEQARKMPLKMLFPLLIFIFPAMMAVILGPIIPVISELFRTLILNARF